jgi:hypothetical protein
MGEILGKYTYCAANNLNFWRSVRYPAGMMASIYIHLERFEELCPMLFLEDFVDLFVELG